MNIPEYCPQKNRKLKESQTFDRSIDWFTCRRLGHSRGVALVIHGLNLDPDRMQAIIAVLNKAGVDVLRLSLQGHGNNFLPMAGVTDEEARLESFKGVSFLLWRRETLKAYFEARQRADIQKAPLFLVGFSYGGLIGLDILASKTQVRFDRMALFAPAARLRGWDYVIRLFSSFPRLVIPTLTHREYLANPGTPIAAYNALFETLDHFETHASSMLNLPTQVFINPADELVSFSGLKRFANNAHLDRWSFQAVKKEESVAPGITRHIIIDERSVGRQTWERIRKALIAHLFADHPRLRLTDLSRHSTQRKKK